MEAMAQERIRSEPDEASLKWIEGLALDEINMEESGIVHINEHLSLSCLLEEASIEFMDRLKDLCELYVAKFNEFRGNRSSGSQIKVFKVSDTVNDFMLFRNSLRLIFSRKAGDLITIGFVASGKDLFASRMDKDDRFGDKPAHQITARVGPFNDISWRIGDEPVDMRSLARHYLSEFIVNSAR